MQSLSLDLGVGEVESAVFEVFFDVDYSEVSPVLQGGQETGVAGLPDLLGLHYLYVLLGGYAEHL